MLVSRWGEAPSLDNRWDGSVYSVLVAAVEPRGRNRRSLRRHSVEPLRRTLLRASEWERGRLAWLRRLNAGRMRLGLVSGAPLPRGPASARAVFLSSSQPLPFGRKGRAGTVVARLLGDGEAEPPFCSFVEVVVPECLLQFLLPPLLRLGDGIDQATRRPRSRI